MGNSGKVDALRKLMGQFDGEFIVIDPEKMSVINVLETIPENQAHAFEGDRIEAAAQIRSICGLSGEDNRRKKVVKIIVPDGEPCGRSGSYFWDAEYSITEENESVKHIIISFSNVCFCVVLSKVFLPDVGADRYFISLPEQHFAIPMQSSLLNTSNITSELKKGKFDNPSFGGSKFAYTGTLSFKITFTVAQVLRDIGDF